MVGEDYNGGEEEVEEEKETHRHPLSVVDIDILMWVVSSGLTGLLELDICNLREVSKKIKI